MRENGPDLNHSGRIGPPPVVNRPVGTLMWIGDREGEEFRDAYRYCESQAAQLAYRHDAADALRRPAAGVRRIIWTQTDRGDVEGMQAGELARHYPVASLLRLLGPLCGGDPRRPCGAAADLRIFWHQANQWLPRWLGPCGALGPVHPEPARSVAVVAHTADAAEPLIELVAANGMTAVWCRDVESFRVRNVDVVWWDDTATEYVDREAWEQRLLAVGRFDTSCHRRHAWLVSSPRPEDCRAAYQAGVERIVTKPARLQPLLEMLGTATDAETETAETESFETPRAA